jgi:hypothetical protein
MLPLQLLDGIWIARFFFVLSVAQVLRKGYLPRM